MNDLGRALRSNGEDTAFYRALTKVWRALAANAGEESGKGERDSVLEWGDSIQAACAAIHSGKAGEIRAHLEELRPLGPTPPPMRKADRRGRADRWAIKACTSAPFLSWGDDPVAYPYLRSSAAPGDFHRGQRDNHDGSVFLTAKSR